MKDRPEELILILDFGSQYTQLITRKVRELGVYSEIKPYNVSIAEIQELKPVGIILSGGPESVYAGDAPLPDAGIFDLSCPILGICYGLQLVAYFHDGQVTEASRREYGPAQLHVDDATDLFEGVSSVSPVWMSHADALSALPPNFVSIAHTANSPFAAIANRVRGWFCVQFHPEVSHSAEGRQIISNFLYEICGCNGTWSAGSFIENAVSDIRDRVAGGKVICALSGGVDSAVAAALVHEAVGGQLTCIFVDNGLMRKNEAEEVEKTFAQYFANFVSVDAADLFLTHLENVDNPEEKRKIIGRTFIEVFEAEAKKIRDVESLVQGTLYPDVIESVSAHGPSVTIKTHHNVGGLPETMNLRLIEPLRELFKDEVREVGKALGISPHILGRHPFPGPGLAVRILGALSKERLDLLREVDAIFIAELKNNHWYDKIWQAFAVLLPVKSVGVMGDNRTYENVVSLRAVTSTDGMTADWGRLPYDLLARASNKIINQVRGVNRVVYDISSKPPSTIEWE